MLIKTTYREVNFTSQKEGSQDQLFLENIQSSYKIFKFPWKLVLHNFIVILDENFIYSLKYLFFKNSLS